MSDITISQLIKNCRTAKDKVNIYLTKYVVCVYCFVYQKYDIRWVSLCKLHFMPTN